LKNKIKVELIKQNVISGDNSKKDQRRHFEIMKNQENPRQTI